MTLYELGCEYRERAQAVLERIHTLNKELPNLTGNDIILMKRRICLLYKDALACKQTAQKLMTYYERRDKNGPHDI